jgi:AcrR family transcriptional regulator
VAAVTLDDICHRTHTSKSQLFHYFPAGKDQLLLAVAQHEADRVLSDQEPYLSNLGSWPGRRGAMLSSNAIDAKARPARSAS